MRGGKVDLRLLWSGRKRETKRGIWGIGEMTRNIEDILG